MCGIFGVGLLGEHKMKSPLNIKLLIEQLLLRNENRGNRASGLSFVNGKKIFTIKKNLAAREFVERPEVKQAFYKHVHLTGCKEKTDKTICIIGHCRQDTKGKPENNKNNHPIIAGKIVGIHNGVIENDEELYRKYQQLFPDFGRSAEVDSEIIFRMLDWHVNHEYMDTNIALKQISRRLVGSYACAAVNAARPYTLWLFKNYSPITFRYYPQKGIFLFSSEARHLDDLEGLNISIYENIEIEGNSAMGIDLLSSRFRKFKLNKPIHTKNKLVI